MPISTNTFTGISGTPGTPQFAEFVMTSTIAETDGSTQALINILHFLRSGGPGTSTEALLFAAINAQITAAVWQPLFNADVINTAQSVRFMDDPTRIAVLFAGLGGGSGAGSRAASFTSTVIRKLGFGRGRFWRGSNHWGPPLEADYDRDQLNVGGQANWAGLVNVLNILRLPFAVGADTWQLIVLSPTQSNLLVNPSIFAGTFVSNCTLNVKLGTMKRRKENVGI